jgi:hypothetical protein
MSNTRHIVDSKSQHISKIAHQKLFFIFRQNYFSRIPFNSYRQFRRKQKTNPREGKMENQEQKQKTYKNIYGVVLQSAKIPPERLKEWDIKFGNVFEIEFSVLEVSEVRGRPATNTIRLKVDKAYEVGTKLYARVSISSSGMGENRRQFTNLVGVIDEVLPAPKK